MCLVGQGRASICVSSRCTLWGHLLGHRGWEVKAATTKSIPSVTRRSHCNRAGGSGGNALALAGVAAQRAFAFIVVLSGVFLGFSPRLLLTAHCSCFALPSLVLPTLSPVADTSAGPSSGQK